MLGKRATEYADIPSEFNDVESAGFFVLMTCFAVAYLPYYRKWVNTVSAIAGEKPIRTGGSDAEAMISSHY